MAITEKDIAVIRSIGRKSINSFSSEDNQKAEKCAKKYYGEPGTKSPFFRACFGNWRAYDTKTRLEYVSVNADFVDNRTEVPRGEFINRDTEWLIKSTSDGVNETASKRGKASDEYHSMKSIDDMIKNALLLYTVVVTDPSKRMEKMRYLFTTYILR